MSLDIKKFASLISYFSAMTGKEFAVQEIDIIYDQLVNMQPLPKTVQASPTHVDMLLEAMQTANGSGFISAIKAYRVLTGAGLKESKDAIEKYRKVVG